MLKPDDTIALLLGLHDMVFVSMNRTSIAIGLPTANASESVRNSTSLFGFTETTSKVISVIVPEPCL